MEFNDNIVRPFDPKEIPNEAFGGEEKVTKILKREIAWNIGLFHIFCCFFVVEKADEYDEERLHDECYEIENQKRVFIVLRENRTLWNQQLQYSEECQ